MAPAPRREATARWGLAVLIYLQTGDSPRVSETQDLIKRLMRPLRMQIILLD